MVWKGRGRKWFCPNLRYWRDEGRPQKPKDGSSVPLKRRLTPHLHGATSQKTAFFTVTAMKTSNLTKDG
jgi:hypothetical protein